MCAGWVGDTVMPCRAVELPTILRFVVDFKAVERSTMQWPVDLVTKYTENNK